MNIKIVVCLIAMAAVASISMIAECTENKTSSEASIVEKLYEDGRIVISLDKIEKTKLLPTKIANDVKRNYPSGLPSSLKLNKGYTYIIFNLTIREIKNVHIIRLFNYEKEETVLIDEKGREYESAHWTIHTDMSDKDFIKGKVTLHKGDSGFLIWLIRE